MSLQKIGVSVVCFGVLFFFFFRNERLTFSAISSAVAADTQRLFLPVGAK